MRRPSGAVLAAGRMVFGLLVVGFFAYALFATWREADGAVLPGPARFLAAGAIWALGLVAGAVAWSVLLESARPRVVAGFFVSQLAKHIPGGVWQAVGQTGYATSAGVPRAKAATGLGVSVVATVAAGLSLAALLAITPGVDTPVRVLAGASIAGVAVLHRRILHAVLRRVPRFGSAAAAALPSQERILAAWLAGIVSLLCSGLAYAALLGGLAAGTDLLTVIGAFSAAWVIGFVVVPIPAGVGLREVVLLGALANTTSANIVVTASIYHRLTTIVVEGLLGVIAVTVLRRHRAQPGVEAVGGNGDEKAERSPSPSDGV